MTGENVRAMIDRGAKIRAECEVKTIGHTARATFMQSPAHEAETHAGQTSCSLQHSRVPRSGPVH